MNRLKNLLKDYKRGLDFKEGDILIPKQGVKPETFGIIDDTVVVLEQDCLVPHEYLVIGERRNPEKPSDRFVKFTINGHDWELV